MQPNRISVCPSINMRSKGYTHSSGVPELALFKMLEELSTITIGFGNFRLSLMYCASRWGSVSHWRSGSSPQMYLPWASACAIPSTEKSSQFDRISKISLAGIVTREKSNASCESHLYSEWPQCLWIQSSATIFGTREKTDLASSHHSAKGVILAPPSSKSGSRLLIGKLWQQQPRRQSHR